MTDDLKPINYYVTLDESEVLMQESDDATQTSEAEQRAQERREKETQQQQQLDALRQVQLNDVYAAKMAAAAASNSAAADQVM
jgi:hypothetical protein